ncbi:MAG TPA: cytochrome c biogenesis protein CcsA [Candidatus Limnocylindria bacterium]|nr:cytochrome c biogenesis protein CcsA [Candidatus Limnocylindria bacterium]
MIETTASPFPTIRLRPWLGILATAASAIAMWMGLIWAPTDAVQGDVYRVIYVHVPTVWLAYFAFVIVFLASLGWLWTRRPWFDALAVSSAEIGVLFTGLFIVAGSIWAKPTWGVWWTWDPRLVTTTVMFLMYLGYLILRSLSNDFARRATRAAILGVIAVVDIPIVHLSVLWMDSVHQLPTVARIGGAPSIDPQMGMTLGIAVIAFTLVYFALLVERMDIERARQERILEARSA